MRCRDLLLIATAMMAAPHSLGAQQKAMSVIGYLASATPDVNAELLPAFLGGLSETGWIGGQNVAIEYRWAKDHYERLPALAADLVSRKVDVIVSTGGTPGALVAKNASSTIPIIFIVGGDPVERGWSPVLRGQAAISLAGKVSLWRAIVDRAVREVLANLALARLLKLNTPLGRFLSHGHGASADGLAAVALGYPEMWTRTDADRNGVAVGLRRAVALKLVHSSGRAGLYRKWL